VCVLLVLYLGEGRRIERKTMTGVGE
jgi:hypothetical protein